MNERVGRTGDSDTLREEEVLLDTRKPAFPPLLVKDGKLSGFWVFRLLAEYIFAPVWGHGVEIYGISQKGRCCNTAGWVLRETDGAARTIQGGVLPCDCQINQRLKDKLGAVYRIVDALGVDEKNMTVINEETESVYQYTITIKKTKCGKTTEADNQMLFDFGVY